MLDRVKDAVHRHTKRLSRHSISSLDYASENQSLSSNDRRGANGTAEQFPNDRFRRSTQALNGFHDGGRVAPNVGTRPSSAGQNTGRVHHGTQGVGEHPAIHPLYGATSMAPRQEISRRPLSANWTPQSRTRHSRVSSQASEHTIDQQYVPERNGSNLEPYHPEQHYPQTTQEPQHINDEPKQYTKAELPRGSSTEAAAATPDNHLHDELPVGKACDLCREAAEQHRNAEPKAPKVYSDFDLARYHTNIDFDHTVHNEPAVTHEEIKPHTHTIYEHKRTRSFHFHEHRTAIQPIKDPNPTILPEQHWAQDHRTGELFKLPDQLGKSLM